MECHFFVQIAFVNRKVLSFTYFTLTMPSMFYLLSLFIVSCFGQLPCNGKSDNLVQNQRMVLDVEHDTNYYSNLKLMIKYNMTEVQDGTIFFSAFENGYSFPWFERTVRRNQGYIVGKECASYGKL